MTIVKRNERKVPSDTHFCSFSGCTVNPFVRSNCWSMTCFPFRETYWILRHQKSKSASSPILPPCPECEWPIQQCRIGADLWPPRLGDLWRNHRDEYFDGDSHLVPNLFWKFQIDRMVWRKKVDPSQSMGRTFVIHGLYILWICHLSLGDLVGIGAIFYPFLTYCGFQGSFWEISNS